MKLQRVLKRISAFLLALLLMVCTPVGDYLYVRNSMSAYATGSAMTAFQWIWAAILAACGVTTTDPVSIDSIADGVSRWVDSLTDNVAKAKYKLLLESMQKASWGFEINAAYEIVQMVKLYLKTIDGYGSDSGIASVPVTTINGYADFNSLGLGYGKENSGFIFAYVSSFYGVMFLSTSRPDAYYEFDGRTTGIAGYDSTGKVSSTSCWEYDFKTYDDAIHFLKTGDFSSATSNRSSSWMAGSKTTDCNVYLSTVDIFSKVTDSTFFTANTTFDFSEEVTENVGVESNVKVQARPIQQAGALRVPATMEEAYAQYIDFTGATTPDELVVALSPSWDITLGGDDTQTGDKDDTYPWVPDITGALNAIKDIITGIASPLTGIEKLIMEIPKILTNIYNGVISIPDQITAFFTIDTAQINTAQAELVAAFKAKFPALYGLSDIFNFSREFTDTVPVISISVPAFLKFAYPNADRIVIFDLTAYKEWFDFCRDIISAILWIAFIRWLLEQFDVKFGVN